MVSITLYINIQYLYFSLYKAKSWLVKIYYQLMDKNECKYTMCLPFKTKMIISPRKNGKILVWSSFNSKITTTKITVFANSHFKWYSYGKVNNHFWTPI